MKHFLFLLCIGCCCTLFAQSMESKPATDEQRVALTAMISDPNIPAPAAKQLINKMQQIVLKSGCAGIGDSRFFVTCSVDELSKEVTSTAPVLYAYTLNFNFFIGDNEEGRMFSSISIEAKGVGENAAKAYLSALKTIQPANPAFKAFVEKGRKKIVEFNVEQPAAPQTVKDTLQVDTAKVDTL